MSTPAVRSVVIEREFPFTPEKIWRALTEGALMRGWLMENDLQPVIGHRFKFRVPPMPKWNGEIDCEVRVIETNKKLSYSWNALGLISVVEWTLVATKNGTLLRTEQSGFRPDQDAAYNGAHYGWHSFIGKLELILNKLS